MAPPSTPHRFRGADRPVPRLQAGRTELVFDWRDDRWGHRVSVGGRPLADSVEGVAAPAEDPRWPASPVLVEVSTVTIGGHPALVGVGLAGRSHFSASIAPHPELPDTLLFEIACRIQEPPGWLGSTYRVDAEPAAVTAASPRPAPAGGELPRTVQWSYAIGPGGITAVRDTPEEPPAGRT